MLLKNFHQFIRESFFNIRIAILMWSMKFDFDEINTRRD